MNWCVFQCSLEFFGILQVSLLEPLFTSYFLVLEQCGHYKRLFLGKIFFCKLLESVSAVRLWSLHLKRQSV